MEYKCSECGHEFTRKEAINVTYDGKVAFCPYFHRPDTLEYLFGFSGMLGTCGYESYPIKKEEHHER